MAKDFEMGYLLDFYGEVLTPKQREMLNQYYNDDLSLSEIGENFGITRQGARDAIKHGETALKELEAKVGFAARYRRVQEKLEELEQAVEAQLELVQKGMYEKAKKNLEEHIYEAHSVEEAKELQQKNGGFIKPMWCGDEACELKMKEVAGMSSRCMPLKQEHLGDTCACCGKPAKHMIYWGVAY